MRFPFLIVLVSLGRDAEGAGAPAFGFSLPVRRLTTPFGGLSGPSPLVGTDGGAKLFKATSSDDSTTPTAAPAKPSEFGAFHRTLLEARLRNERKVAQADVWVDASGEEESVEPAVDELVAAGTQSGGASESFQRALLQARLDAERKKSLSEVGEEESVKLGKTEAFQRTLLQARMDVERKAKVKAEEEAKAKVEEEARVKEEEKAKVAAAEKEAKAKAEEEAKAAAEAQAKAEEEARLKEEEEVKAAAAAQAKAEEEARLKAEEEANAKAEEEAKAAAEAQAKAEEETRLKAEEEAKAKAEEEEKAAAEAKAKAEEEARLKEEEEVKAAAEAQKKTEEEARLKVEEEARLKAAEEAKAEADEEARLMKEEAKAEAKEEAQHGVQEEINALTERTESIKNRARAVSDRITFFTPKDAKEKQNSDMSFSLVKAFTPSESFDELKTRKGGELVKLTGSSLARALASIVTAASALVGSIAADEEVTSTVEDAIETSVEAANAAGRSFTNPAVDRAVSARLGLLALDSLGTAAWVTGCGVLSYTTAGRGERAEEVSEAAESAGRSFATFCAGVAALGAKSLEAYGPGLGKAVEQGWEQGVGAAKLMAEASEEARNDAKMRGAENEAMRRAEEAIRRAQEKQSAVKRATEEGPVFFASEKDLADEKANKRTEEAETVAPETKPPGDEPLET